jgi:hypothetical protein
MTHCAHEPICKFYPSYCEERKQACPHGAGCRYDSRSNIPAFGAPLLTDPCAKPCCISPSGVITEQCRSNPCAEKFSWYQQQHDINTRNNTLKELHDWIHKTYWIHDEPEYTHEEWIKQIKDYITSLINKGRTS